jgi:16S rRNA (cytosine1402-N4)-methyltransferase
VLINEVKTAFEPLKEYSSPIYFDGTFGRGGHYREIKAMIPQMKAIAFDQDPEAIEYGKKNFAADIESGSLTLIHDNFVNFSSHELPKFDFMLLDLGVSSPQLDQPGRGFSFYHQGPLDMRMNNSTGATAADIIHSYSEKELIQLFQELGEVKSPFRVVKAIVHDRETKRFDYTKDLSGLIERVDGWRRKGFHPATQYFMALRLAVNNELGVISEVIPQMMAQLNLNGRLAVISFHSLEDRIIKNLFKETPSLGFPLHKKVIHPSREEEVANPRSRSSKLRVFIRGNETSV